MKKLIALLTGSVAASAFATTVLYNQNFENPVNFVNDGGDVNIYRTVNELYGNQPSGFQFYQTYTSETLLIGGQQAWGVGFQDPQGKGGKYTLAQLSSAQDDILGLSFNIGSYDFLNFQLDISSIDLDRWGGPFVPYTSQGSAVPKFRLSLYDNPTGAIGLGTGGLLDFEDITGLSALNRYTFNWSNHVVALDAAGNTNGNVTLRIDVLEGGYAAMDNFRIAASDTQGDVGNKVPDSLPLSALLGSLLALAALHRRVQRRA
jgi:hypothetical protein